MRKHLMPEMREGGVNVTPLIDIVMCLIIFFMLVAKIGIDTGNDKSVTVPPAFLGIQLKDLGNTLTLNVSNGPLLNTANPEPLVTCMLKGELEELKVHANAGGRLTSPLYDVLKMFKDGDPKNSVPPNPDFKVILRIDQNAQYEFVQPVLAECTRAGITYDFATQGVESPGE